MAPEGFKHGFVIAQAAQIGDNGFIGDDIAARFSRSFDSPLDTLLKVGHQIASIAAKYLVATFTTQHYLVLFRSKTSCHELRKGTRPPHRGVQMIDHFFNVIDKIL